MMFAWDLDPDTHSHFRGFLDVFINKRKISTDLREFVLNTRSRAITYHMRPGIDLRNRNFNELRISLPRRIYNENKQIKAYYCGLNIHIKAPNLIEGIHPPEYHHNAKKITEPSQKHTNPKDIYYHYKSSKDS